MRRTALAGDRGGTGYSRHHVADYGEGYALYEVEAGGRDDPSGDPGPATRDPA
jgi:hypothetical protein